MLGDVGSEHSMSSTVIGDTVNTASRLQGLTRTLETPIAVADAVVKAIGGRTDSTASEALARLRDQGAHELRGRAAPVRIWTCDPADLPKSRP